VGHAVDPHLPFARLQQKHHHVYKCRFASAGLVSRGPPSD
jgi:hypothetical protein